MRTFTIDLARDYISLALLGFGISLAPHEFFGGLFLALAAGSMVARHRKSTKRLTGILLTSAIAAITALLIFERWVYWNFPPQLVMLIAGFGSSWFLNISVKVMDGIENRSDTISEKIIDKILPGNDK